MFGETKPKGKPVLPKPDTFGNHWFGNKPSGPAIFHAGVDARSGQCFVSLGAGGLVWEGVGERTRIKMFDGPAEAMEVLVKAGAI